VDSGYDILNMEMLGVSLGQVHWKH